MLFYIFSYIKDFFSFLYHVILFKFNSNINQYNGLITYFTHKDYVYIIDACFHQSVLNFNLKNI